MRAREAGRPPVPVEHVELTSQHALQTARAADVIDHDQPLSFHLNHKTPRAEDSLYEVLPAVDVDDSPEAQLGHVATEDAVLDHHPTIRDGQHRAEPPAEASQHPQCWKRHEHDQDPIQNPWRARELDECGDSSGDGDSRQQRRSQQPGPVRVLRDEHTLAFEVQVVHASVSVARGQSPIAEVWGIRRRSSGTTDRGPSDQRGEGWRECVPAQLRRCPSPRSDCQPLWARGGVSGSVSRPALCSEALGALSPSCGPKPLQRPRTAPRHARLVPHRFPSQDSVRPTREPTPGTAPMALGSPHPRVGPSARTLPPAGADDAYDNALGFAFGEAQAEGWWGGSVGRFTADQAAVAGKLLYDAVVWGDPIPPMDPGVLAAYDSIDGWFNQASGATGVPTMTTGLVGGGASFSQSASWSVQVVFPGTGHGLAGLPLALSIADGSFNAPGGPSEIGVSTDANGQVTVPIYANGSSVTVTALAGVGQIGLDFYRPTADELSAQQLVAFPAPITLQSHQVLSTEEETGTIKVVKSGDDQSYYPVQGAVFEVLDQSSGNVEATLTTRADGLTPAAVVASGTYTVREVTAPPGYSLAPDQTATVDAGSTTTVSFTGPDEDRIHP